MPRRARLRPRDLARADSRRGTADSSPSPGPRPTTTRSSSKECANRRVDDPAGCGTARRVAWEGRGETHLAERGGNTERRRGFQRALNHEHRVCASRATRSVSPPTRERRFFGKLLQQFALHLLRLCRLLRKKKWPKNQSISSVFSVFFFFSNACSVLQKSMTVQPLGCLGIILSQRCFGVVTSPFDAHFSERAPSTMSALRRSLRAGFAAAKRVTAANAVGAAGPARAILAGSLRTQVRSDCFSETQSSALDVPDRSAGTRGSRVPRSARPRGRPRGFRSRDGLKGSSVSSSGIAVSRPRRPFDPSRPVSPPPRVRVRAAGGGGSSVSRRHVLPDALIVSSPH